MRAPSTRAAGLVLLATLSGCVIRYGEGPKPAPTQESSPQVRPVDFRSIERQLSELVDKAEEVDARDRLERAWALAEDMRGADPAAQHVVRAYLEKIIEIESRANPTSTPLQTRVLSEGFGGATTVDSAELAGPEPLPEPEEPPEVDLLDPMEMEAAPDGEGEPLVPPEEEPGPDVEILLADAGRHLENDQPEQAMAALEPCRERPCWETVGPIWVAARDHHVFSQKEDLAVRFLELRGEPDVETVRAGLLEIQGALSTLRATWPDSAHAEEIEKHMARVQKELELLPEE